MASQQRDALRDFAERQKILEAEFEKSKTPEQQAAADHAPYFRKVEELKAEQERQREALAKDSPELKQEQAAAQTATSGEPQAAPEREATPEGSAGKTPEQERQDIVEAFFERQRTGIVNNELDQAAAAFISSEAFASAKHEATRQNEKQSQGAEMESQGKGQADISATKEMTDSRAARLAAAHKYFEKRDAELAEKQQGQEKDDELGLDLSR